MFVALFLLLSLTICEIVDYPYFLKSNELNVALALDASLSVPIEQIKTAAKLVVDELHENDILSIVTFNSGAEVVLDAEEVVDKVSIKSIIDTISIAEWTDIYTGMETAYEQVQQNYNQGTVNIIILATDGWHITNYGTEDRSEEDHFALVEKYVTEGIQTSVIGFRIAGSAAPPELDLEAFAEKGQGSYYYVKNDADLSTAFLEEVERIINPVQERTVN